MKIIALILSVLMTAAVMPLQAQVVAAPSGTPAVPPVAKPSCPCDNPNFKPLTDKARAAEAYWNARRKVKVSTVISGTAALFSLLLQSQQGLNEATQSYDHARSEMWEAKATAEKLGALKVTGDDIDGTIEFKLVKGVDYTL